jgi:membrane protease subunit HflC
MATRIMSVFFGLALLVGLSSIFIVDEREVAIKFQLGEIVRSDYQPGLHIKAPWPVNNVRKFDRRILTLDTAPERFLTGEKKNVTVDFFVKWRKNGLQLEFDNRTIRQVVSDDRSEMMEHLTAKGNAEVAQFGIEIVAVRIKQIELPDDVRNSVFERMRAERERIAKELRAQGQEAAKGIQAVAERNRTVILAEANRDAEVTRGEGDARATEIYADAFGRNAEFFQFYRSMNAYRTALSSQQDVLVLEPDSEFFKYFHDNTGD